MTASLISSNSVYTEITVIKAFCQGGVLLEDNLQLGMMIYGRTLNI